MKLYILTVLLLGVSVYGSPSVFELALFYPVTSINDDGQRVLGRSGVTELIPALAAIKHVNEKDDSIVPAIATLSCDVQLNFTLLDSMLDFGRTLQQYFSYREQTTANGIIGPGRSSTTIPLSFVSSVEEIPIVGYAATGQDLDDDSSHPFFSRTITSDSAVAEAIVAFLADNDYPVASLLYIDDAYGKSIKDTIFEFSVDYGVELELFPYLDDQGNSSLHQALEDVRSTDLNIIVAVTFTSNLPLMMTLASELNLITGKQWIFTDSVELLDSSLQTQLIADALGGALQITPAGGLEKNVAYSNFIAAFSGFGLFDLVESVYPGGVDSVDTFESEEAENITQAIYDSIVPSVFSTYSYDSVLTYAFALDQDNNCAQFKANGTFDFISTITDPSFSFNSTTGTVKFNEVGSRDVASADIVVYTLTFDSDTLEQELEISGQFVSRSWVLSLPAELELPLFTNLPVEDRNLLPFLDRLPLYLIGGVVIILAIAAAVWVVRKAKTPVMHASQPLFLVIIATGCMICTSSIYLTGWDETSFQASTLSSMCNVKWALFSLGLSLITTALNLKLYRIVVLFTRVQQLGHSNVIKLKHLVVIVAIVLVFNFILLALLFSIAPLQYERQIITTDRFGQIKSSVGVCQTSIITYVLASIIVLYHVVLYLVGATFAVKARNIPPDFQESKWVLLAYFTQVQLTILGVPILFALDQDANNIRFLVIALLTSLLNFSVLALLFTPKVYRIRYGHKSIVVYDSANRSSGVVHLGDNATSRISRSSPTPQRSPRKPSSKKSSPRAGLFYRRKRGDVRQPSTIVHEDGKVDELPPRPPVSTLVTSDIATTKKKSVAESSKDSGPQEISDI